MRKFILTMFAIGISLMSFAQEGRAYLRKKIESIGECKSVAITEKNGDLILYGRHGWYSDNCPEKLRRKLHQYADDDEEIKDVELTNNGSWLILVGRNGYSQDGVPSDMLDKLYDFNEENEEILSASFNDDGQWIIITDEHISTSSSSLTDWVYDGSEEYGSVVTACVASNCIVVVYKDGYKYKGDYPEDLREKLRKTDMKVRRLKIAGNSWFFADKYGKNDYRM